jgi:hypothetical protein
VVPKPSESAPPVDSNDDEEDDEEDDEPSVTPVPSFAVPTTTTPVVEPSSTPTQEVVTAGAGRNVVVALPAVLAAVMLVV